MFDGFHSPLQVKVVQRAERCVECEYLPKLDTPSLRASYASLTQLVCLELRQLGGLGSFGGVILDTSEDARTRGFPSPSFGGFGFISLV